MAMSQQALPWSDLTPTIRRLGKGGQGTTYLVERDGLHAVAKLLLKQDDPKARARMRSEVAALTALESTGARVPLVLEDMTAEFKDISTDSSLRSATVV